MVNVSQFIMQILNEFLGILYIAFLNMNNIIIFDASLFGVGTFYVSLFDFLIGITAVGIITGAFVRINKADNFNIQR